MRFLLDTSVTTRLRLPAVADRLRMLDREGIARTRMTDLEMGFRAQNAAQWDLVDRNIREFPLVTIGDAHFARAHAVQRLLAVAGVAGRKIPDLLIAAAAESEGLAVLHYDADFDLIASVTGQPVEWIVERGSVG